MMEGLQDRRNSKTGSFSISKGYPEEPWHSTPVKKNLFAANETPDVSYTRTRPAALSLHDLSKPTSSFSLTQNFQTPDNGLEASTMQRQRLELQLLIAELKDREEELSSMLKLKDKDVIEATNHILELSGRLCDLEKSLEELRTRESKTLREMEEHKHRFRKSRHENTQLKDELQEKTIENNSQREELIRLKQENQLLKKEVTAVELQRINEDKSWRDELLELSRSKQARAESELVCLRQVCENQQNDLQLLKLNLESAREALRHHEGQRSRESAADLSLHLDCPSPCHQSRRSSVSLPDSTISIELCGNEDGCSSSTSRLQRLLAESQEMVASLESSAKKSVSPMKSQCPTNCDAGCHLQNNHGNGRHSQTSTHSQEGSQTSRESDSQMKSGTHSLQESK